MDTVELKDISNLGIGETMFMRMTLKNFPFI